MEDDNWKPLSALAARIACKLRRVEVETKKDSGTVERERPTSAAAKCPNQREERAHPARRRAATINADAVALTGRGKVGGGTGWRR